MLDLQEPAAKRRTRPQMLAACVQTDSKNENRATKYHGDVSTLVPLKRNSAIKYHGDVNFLTTVGGGVSQEQEEEVQKA